MQARVEMWAGVECSLNRVEDRYFDQLQRGGHYERPDDIERLAALGVRVVRFPVLWERHTEGGQSAWQWTDEALERLRGHGIRPIVGLVHHGGGPSDTSLVDPRFPERLAEFARSVAERYPWVDAYTPINEPLTTARFATLYGHWYPHARDPRAFAAAMVGQCRAVALAMRAIREVTPQARLIQTEDLGKTHSTRPIAYQAKFENERRWLTFDLLLGRVVAGHPLAGFLRWAGVPREMLATLAAEPCPPDVIGINHYLTSERFLDHRADRYPEWARGGNHRHRYADIEAVRVLREGAVGPYALMRETWERYRRPLAVTEAHLACTREQQLRWLDEVWQAAVRLREEGADIRAVTAWSAFGAHDWASLLTRADGTYEPGLYDLRAPAPRATALATMVRSLATTGEYDHPVLHAEAWWRRDQRLSYPPVAAFGTTAGAIRVPSRNGQVKALLITGARGTLGQAVIRACVERGIPHRALTRRELDIASARSVAAALTAYSPWAVVNCAGYVRVDDAERERDACRRENADGAATIAAACGARGVRFVTVSTDLVFDGTKDTPYVEQDATAPLNEYGRSKAEAERRVLAAHEDALVVRASAFFGDHDDHNFVTIALRALANGERFTAAADLTVSPTYVPELVDAMLDLLIDGERGIWHLANAGAVTWAELAGHAARLAGVDATGLVAAPAATLGLAAARPRNSALASARATLMAPLEHALARYASARPWERRPQRFAAPRLAPRAALAAASNADAATGATRAEDEV